MSFITLALILSLRDKEPDAKVTLDFQNVSIKEFLADLQRKTGISLERDESALKRLDPGEKVSFKVQDVTLKTALLLLFRPYGLEVRWTDKKKYVLTVSY